MENDAKKRLTGTNQAQFSLFSFCCRVFLCLVQTQGGKIVPLPPSAFRSPQAWSCIWRTALPCHDNFHPSHGQSPSTCPADYPNTESTARIPDNGRWEFYFAWGYLVFVFDLIFACFSITSVILIDPAKAWDHLSRPRFGKKVVQAFFKFSRAFSCRIDIGDANAFAALRKKCLRHFC